jgi:CheY-like chemotaxis protein
MNARILIVDDNPTNLKLARDVLAFEGFNVEGAESAERALQVLQGFSAELVLMDLAMPGMDGFALTRILKSTPATRDLVVVALTASAMKGDDARAKEAGCDGYITKPINTRTFASEVAAFLKKE